MPKHRKTRKQQNQERLEKQQREALARKIEKRIATLTHSKFPDHKSPDVFVPKPRWRPDDKVIPSKGNGVEPVRTVKAKPKYEDPELIQREQEALKEIERKKKRTAPAYSKGGYMYITDGTDPRDIGKKNPT